MKRINNIAVEIAIKLVVGVAVGVGVISLGFGLIIRFLVPLLLIFYVVYELYRLWQEKRYELVKHIMIDVPIYFVIFNIIAAFNLWYKKKPVVINFTTFTYDNPMYGGFLGLLAYIIVLIALYRIKRIDFFKKK